MGLTRTIVASAVLSLASFVGIAAIAATTDPKREFLPAVQLIGHDSKVHTSCFVLAQDEVAWAKLWAEHTGTGASDTPPTRHATPKVDFSKYMVVGAFGGERTNTDGQRVLRVLEDEENFRIQYEATTFQTSSGLGGKVDSAVKTTPYGLWVIEKTAKPVVIEEGIQRSKNSPIEWKVVEKFESR